MTDTDAFWTGALSMGLAISHSWLKRGNGVMALHVIEEVLRQFSESAVISDELRAQLAEYWIGDTNDDDHDVLRSVR